MIRVNKKKAFAVSKGSLTLINRVRIVSVGLQAYVSYAHFFDIVEF